MFIQIMREPILFSIEAYQNKNPFEMITQPKKVDSEKAPKKYWVIGSKERKTFSEILTEFKSFFFFSTDWLEGIMILRWGPPKNVAWKTIQVWDIFQRR